MFIISLCYSILVKVRLPAAICFQVEVWSINSCIQENALLIASQACNLLSANKTVLFVALTFLLRLALLTNLKLFQNCLLKWNCFETIYQNGIIFAIMTFNINFWSDMSHEGVLVHMAPLVVSRGSTPVFWKKEKSATKSKIYTK